MPLEVLRPSDHEISHTPTIALSRERSADRPTPSPPAHHPRLAPSMPLTARHIFLTGQPGVGKTTLAVAAVRAVPEGSCCGFYTEERRSASGDRVGFDVVVLGSNARGPLANLGGGKPLVGKYSVNVPSFEELALPSLDASSSSAVTLIDEVGKMELYSERFLPKVEALLAADGRATVLGTLPMPRYGHKIAPVERIRDAPDVAVVKLLK